MKKVQKDLAERHTITDYITSSDGKLVTESLKLFLEHDPEEKK